MNISQIKYFIEVAECKSFSEAAKHLYITQPTLNRQITAIEADLNMQLFIRSPKGLKLTPAGIVLYDEFKNVIHSFENGVKKAMQASEGYSATIKIGIVSGVNLGIKLKELIQYFDLNHPNIKIMLEQYSFKELLEKLNHKELDLIITYDFHLSSCKHVSSCYFMPYHAAWIVPKSNPLSQKEEVFYKDMKNQQLLIVNETECLEGVQFITDNFMSKAGFYPNFFFVENMDNVALWLSVSDKCAMLNLESYVVDSPDVKVFESKEETSELEFRAGWLPENDNFALGLIKNYLQTRT